MSRTYQALEGAEGKGSAQRAPSGARAPLGENAAPEIRWDLARPARLEYQKVRVWLTNAVSRGQQVQAVMVVSCRASTGSTTTAALLATTLALGKRLRVLIVDGNLRTPTLNRVFNVAENGGFTDVVSEGVPAETRIHATSHPNLSVLTTGQISIWPAEVFEGKAIDDLIVRLKRQFDFIIFDTAPLLEFPDAYALAPKVDAVILVVGAERTSIRDAQEARRRLELAGGRVVGVVLNRDRDYVPRFLRRLFRAKR